MSRHSAAYSRTQIFLHWIIAALVLAVLFTHEEFLAAQNGLQHGLALSAGQIAQNELHIWGGAAVLPLAFWRLFVRMRAGVPDPPASEPRIRRAFASIAHVLLYALIFVLPVSGMLSYYGFLPAVSTFVHKSGEPVLFILVIVHVGAAFTHNFVWKTDVLRRMLKSPWRPN